MNDLITIASVSWKLQSIISDQQFFQHLESLLLLARERKAEIVLLPENINYEFLHLYPGFKETDVSELLYPYSDAVALELKRYAVESGMIIIGGSHYFKRGLQIRNEVVIAFPNGDVVYAPKNRLTEYEKSPLHLSAGDALSVLPTSSLGVLLCYDSEFPEAARLLVERGAKILFVPYYTDSVQGYHRIRYSGLARSVENQIYVVQAGLIGSLGVEPCMGGCGRASFFAPPIGGFPDDGLLCEGAIGEEEVVVATLSLGALGHARANAAVRNFEDRNSGFILG